MKYLREIVDLLHYAYSFLLIDLQKFVERLFHLTNNRCVMLGWHLLAKPVKLRCSRSFLLAAVVGDTAAVPSNYSKERVSDSDDPSLSEKSDTNGENRDERDNVGSLDDQKMNKVCDKLIGVFMVDKPTPTDWRRLLAFSKEWDNIRPHFYKRCQERADSEDDPGMKHKLLRLGRKLKEVDLAILFASSVV